MKEVLKETLKEAKEAMKKKASAKKATATKEATKKDTASAKPADTAKVGSKDERTSPHRDYIFWKSGTISIKNLKKSKKISGKFLRN